MTLDELAAKMKTAAKEWGSDYPDEYWVALAKMALALGGKR